MRIVLICDFEPGLLNRVLAVYNGFRTRPDVILIRRRRGDFVSNPHVSKTIEIPLAVEPEMDPLRHPAKLFPTFARTAIYLVYLVFLLPRLVLNGRVHLVHAHFLMPQGLAGLIVSQFTRAPLILTAAGSDVHVLATHTLPREIIRRLLFPHSHVLAVSQALLGELKTLGSKNSNYLPNCVQMPVEHGAGKKLCRILFVGTLIPEKRPDVLIRAFSKVTSKVSEATLTIVGTGSMLRTLEALASNLGLERRIFFTGYLNDRQLMPIYEESGMFVLPSTGEGLSLALLEAMAFGLRIIVSKPAGAGIIEDGVQGLVFPVDDVDELARRMLWVLENPVDSSHLSSGARSICERQYSISAVAPKLEQLYAELCNNA
jgi:glycosyltransferase involved in cell wall biosynthesis